MFIIAAPPLTHGERLLTSRILFAAILIGLLEMELPHVSGRTRGSLLLGVSMIVWLLLSRMEFFVSHYAVNGERKWDMLQC